MLNIEQLIQQSEEIEKIHKQTDISPSIRLLEDERREEIEEILRKFNDDKVSEMDDRDKLTLLEARNQIQASLGSQVTMCKIIPIEDVNDYINFNYDLGNFMLRKADLDQLIHCNYEGNIIDTLYKCLRLDYEESKFISCKRMAIIELKINDFACRVPLDSTCYENFKGKKININDKAPYTGMGWTKSSYGIPEFYVTIASEIKKYINQSGELVSVGYGRFPLRAFNTTIYVADKDTNSMVEIASFDNETTGNGNQIYDKFEICNDEKNRKIRDKIIEEEKIII